MASENLEEMFQLIKYDLTKGNTEIRELIPPRIDCYNWLFVNRGMIQELCLWALFFLLNYEQLSIYFFSRFHLLHLFFSNKKTKSHDLSSVHLTRFLFKIIQLCKTWNVIGPFPPYKLEDIELILFFKSCIIRIFVQQVCTNSLFHTAKLVESCKFYHTGRLM